MNRMNAVIIVLAAAITVVSCAGNSGRCSHAQPGTVIVPSRVPEHLRDLVPMALKWGTGDPALRDELEKAISADEMRQLRDSLHGRTAAVSRWLEGSERTGIWSAEQCVFRFLLEFYNDMNEVELMKALKKQRLRIIRGINRPLSIHNRDSRILSRGRSRSGTGRE